jgi:hypothetical protein
MAQAQEPWLELLLIPPSRRLAAVRAAREVTFRRCRLQLHYRKFDNLAARLAEEGEEILLSAVIASICSPRGSVAAGWRDRAAWEAERHTGVPSVRRDPWKARLELRQAASYQPNQGPALPQVQARDLQPL